MSAAFSLVIGRKGLSNKSEEIAVEVIVGVGTSVKVLVICTIIGTIGVAVT
ncbi:hypothetical protein SDC9_200661 [bioreactor metagenome]|uniref:Uncharacterized protein n=1 Tax=bioreactor metagenome TaxID=1076179 RepID=A0A645INU0_9ZZZZ